MAGLLTFADICPLFPLTEAGVTYHFTKTVAGTMDEVRISNVTRGASQFIFSSGLLPCDVDGGGCGISDFNIIKNNLFNTGVTRAQGDLDENGIVDFADFRIWKSGAGAGFGNVSLFGVPEPGSILLSLVAGFLLVALIRCRRRPLQ